MRKDYLNTAFSDIDVEFFEYFEKEKEEDSLAFVTVIDKRNELGKRYYWTGLGGREHSVIKFSPTETEIVKNVVETKLTETLYEMKKSQRTEFLCELNTFEIHNTASLLSFDFICEIDFELIHGANRYHITATKDLSAYWFPGSEFVSKLVAGCFKNMDDDFFRIAQEIANNE